MNIFPVSDVHLEFRDYDPACIPSTADDRDNTILVMAGDITMLSQPLHFLHDLADRFNRVIWVPGNHEYYTGDVVYSSEQARDWIRSEGLSDKVHFLDDDAVVIDGVAYCGATAWTDFNDSISAAFEAKYRMNDFALIERAGKPLTIEFMVNSHLGARQFFDSCIDRFPDNKVVCVSHHGLHPDVIDPQRHSSRSLLNYAYASNAAVQMGWLGLVDLFISGHTHHCVDYNVEGSRFVANCLGYPCERTGFDPNLRIKV